jgi:hypothetical protein
VIERLSDIVSERRNSFEIRDYTKRRDAALKARAKSRGSQYAQNR